MQEVSTSNKIFALDGLVAKVKEWKQAGDKVVFTNGCFDVFHAGHAYVLNTAKSFGHRLVVGLNSDTSVTALKGSGRPVNSQNNRCYVLASLEAVDAVVLFAQPTPIDLILAIRPDILVKGGDYDINDIVGAKEVIADGGEVRVVPLVQGLSSTAIIGALK